MIADPMPENVFPHPAQRFLVPAEFALLLLCLALPALLGNIGNAAMLAISSGFLLCLLAPALRVHRLRSTAAPMFASAFGLVAIAYALAGKSPDQFLFAFNLAPLLLAVPVLWLQPWTGPQCAQKLGAHALAGALVAAATGVIGHHLLGQARVGAHVVNPIHFGNISVFLGFLSLLGMFGTGWRAWLCLLGPALGLVGALYSGSRGPLLTFVVLTLIAAAFLAVHHRARARTMVAGALALAAFGIGALALSAVLDLGKINDMPDLVGTWLATGQIADRSAQIRLDLYQGGLRAFLESPVFGHGWWNLIPAVEPHVSEDTWAFVNDFTHLHNDAIDFMVAGGVMGLAAYLLILFAPLVAAWRMRGDAAGLPRLYGAFVLTFGFGASGLTNLLLGNALQTTLFAFLTALIIGQSGPDQRTGGENGPDR